MNWRNTADHYGTMAITAHWMTAIFIVCAWSLGMFGHFLPRGLARQDGFLIHVFLGLAVLLILAPRSAMRWMHGAPISEKTPLGTWGEYASVLAHYALYVLLMAVPVLGILTQFARGHALPLFGLFNLPSPIDASRNLARALRRFHELAANAIVILAGLHACAALAHHWLFRDDTLRRMLPVVPPMRTEPAKGHASAQPDSPQFEVFSPRRRRVSNLR